MDPFAMTVIKLKEMGFFHLLLYILSSAVFYGLLRKTQIFGPPERNVAVNATVSFVAAFMVLAVPILRGIDVVSQFEMFFIQSLSAILIMMVGVLFAGMVFPPDLPGHLSKVFGKGGFWSVVLVGGIIVGLVVLVSSSMTDIFYPEKLAIPEDVLITIGVVIILAITVVLVSALGGKKE
jgi:FtsH-binding integral membrane protein